MTGPELAAWVAAHVLFVVVLIARRVFFSVTGA